MQRLFLLFILLILYLDSFAGINDTMFRVMTYNIRYAGNEYDEGVNAWKYRKELIAKLIIFNKPDVIGVQEAFKFQLDDLVSILPEFSYAGKGRDDGNEKGEYSAILYNRNKFELLEENTFWLSETPGIPSKGWDAALNRVCTWAKFREKESNKIFYYFNTHFDHVGEQARNESALLILEKIKEIAKEDPVLLTGDFNDKPDSKTYEILKSALNDAFGGSLKGHYGSSATFNDFGRNVIPGYRIDYIFLNKRFRSYIHGILEQTFEGLYPSDHMPVLADVFIQ